MIRKSINKNWLIKKGGSLISSILSSSKRDCFEVNLPHDIMITLERNEKSKKGTHSGYFPGGTYTYIKEIFIPQEYRNKVVFLEFEGVSSHAKVFINNSFAGKCPNPYSSFYVQADKFLKYGEKNYITVIVKSPSEPDSRWYTGLGIYRNVNLMVGDLLYIDPQGIKIDTPEIEKNLSVVRVRTPLSYKGIDNLDAFVVTEILDINGDIVGLHRVPVSIFHGEKFMISQKITIKNPNLWSIDSPYLYKCNVKIEVDDKVVDKSISTFGIRKLQLDTENGLRINNKRIKLRGACIHHDNGVIGACTFDRAEERRIEKLKKAGFNAVRSSHHPMSKSMLNACDRVGMLVMDEAFDMWNTAKTDYDFSLYFEEWWEYVVEDMVHKDFNHPSVIMYSIGNEIPETGSKTGSSISRKLADKISSLDPTRYTTNSINGMMSVLNKLEEIISSNEKDNNLDGISSNQEKDINDMMSNMHEIMDIVCKHEIVEKDTEESFSVVDVAGYNYMTPRYKLDSKLYPNRIIVGSETFPPQIAENWSIVKRSRNVIGDFTWTGWDYLGEAGIGKFDYTMNEKAGIYGFYPWYIAYCGDIDILGNRRPISYYREIVFGLRKEPYIAVQRPEFYGKPFLTTPWVESDTLSSWTWPNFIDKPVKVEVYSNADEVELFLNTNSLGRFDVGEKSKYKAVFDIQYQPGELTAVAYTEGEEVGRYNLQTAKDDLRLDLDLDRSTVFNNEGDLAYLMISLTDSNGILQNSKDREVTISIEGSAVIQGFGSANPTSTSNFFETKCTTFDGKVLAVIRPKNTGMATITVSADDCKTKTAEILIID